MKSFVKKISYKLLVASMITVLLSFFSVSPMAEAKITLEDNEFYYSGVQEAEVTWGKSLWQRIASSLGEIANYLLGILLLGVRGVVIGYIEIMEIILTAILGVQLHPIDYIMNALPGKDTYAQDIVNIEKIIFDRVDVLDINIFKTLAEEEEEEEMGPQQPAPIDIQNYTPEEEKEEVPKGEKLLNIIRESVAKWYYILRLIVIAFMLLVLIFIGIKMAISTVASDKAVYKKMFTDWVVGMIIIFSMHYFMIITININEAMVKSLSDLSLRRQIKKEYQYGDEMNMKTATEIETTLYESARTRAYSIAFTDGFTGMIIYGALVYYAWKFAFIYFKRLMNIMILTVMAPVIGGTYAINKTLSGKAAIFSKWFKEYIITVLIQLFHCILYVTFISTALDLSLISLVGVVMALILLSFMSKADNLLRELFNVTGGTGSLFGEMTKHTGFKQLRSQARNLTNAVIGGTVGKTALKATTRLATKPARLAVEKAWVNTMKKRQQSEKFQNKKIQKKKEIEEGINEYRNQPEIVQKENELYTKQENLLMKQAKLKDREQGLNKEIHKNQELIQKAQEKIDEVNKSTHLSNDNKEKHKTRFKNFINRNKNKTEVLERQLSQTRDEISSTTEELENLNLEIEEFEKSVRNEFLETYIRSGSSWEVIKNNVEDLLLDPELYLQEEPPEEEIQKKAKKMFKDYKLQKEIAENESFSEDERQKAKDAIKEMEDKAKQELIFKIPIKTKRVGGVDKAFWRKKKSGVGKTFFDNAKWDQILGLSGEEKKLVQDELKFAKSVLTGVVSGVAGFATLGVSPGIGLLLLSKANTTRIQTSSRIRQLQSSPSKHRYYYKFKAFSPVTENTIIRDFEREIRYMESKLTRKNAKKHSKLANALINGADAVITPISAAGVSLIGLTVGASLGEGFDGYMTSRMEPKQFKRKLTGIDGVTQEKLDEIYQKKVRTALKNAHKEVIEYESLELKTEYNEQFEEYREVLKDSFNKKTNQQLAVEDTLSTEEAIKVNDNIIIYDDNNKLPEPQFTVNMTHDEKVKTVLKNIKDHKALFISNAITDIAVSKGITDMNEMFIDEVDMIQIRDIIKGKFESKGIVQKGELKLDKVISSESINNTLRNMRKNTNKGQSEAEIATKIVQKAVFKLMADNGITNTKDLEKPEVQKGIQRIIKSQLMSKSSKDSMDVINKITGDQNGNDRFELPDSLKDTSSIIKNVKSKMKTKKVSQIGVNMTEEEKKEIVEKRIIRETNETKAQLETAVYIGDRQQITEKVYPNVSEQEEDQEIVERKLKLLLLLSELQKTNRDAYRVDGKSKKTKEQTLVEATYHKRKVSKKNMGYNEIINPEDATPREQELNVLLHGKNDIVGFINS